MMQASNPYEVRRWSQQLLAAALLSGLGEDDPQIGRWVNGRIVGLLASPFDGSAQHMALGLSALKQSNTTPEHSHPAEEIAVVLGGAGTIHIGADRVDVTQGDIVLTPPNITHRTQAHPTQPLTILWIYAPPDSALRWLADNPLEY